MRKLTAQVNVRADDGKAYAIAFVDGAVAAAVSPLPNDSVTRVALTSHFVSPSQVGEITRRLATDKHRDEVDIVAEIGKLSAEHIAMLRRRLMIQRAARTFAIDRATFEIDDTTTLQPRGAFRVSLGAVVFHGVRMNLSEQRLVDDMRELGTTFRLRETVSDEDVAALAFETSAKSFLAAVRKGTTLAELELASHRELEPRTSQAMLYALVCAGLCDAVGGQAVDRSIPPPPRTTTDVGTTTPPVSIKVDQPLVTRARTTSIPANVPRTTTPIPTTNATRRLHTTILPTNVPRVATPPSILPSIPPTNVPRTQSSTSLPRTTSRDTPPPSSEPPTRLPIRSASQPPRTQTPSTSPLDDFIRETTTSQGTALEEFRRDTATPPYVAADEFRPDSSAHKSVGPIASRTITEPRTITERDRAKRDVEVLIAQRLTRLEQACDYFAILGLPFEAPLDLVRNNFVETSRKLQPDSLAHLGIIDESRAASRVLAQVKAAYETLSDPTKRRDYINAVRRGEPTPLAPRARTGELDKAELAAEAFHEGESALKRDDIPRAVEDLGRACQLAPNNLEYMMLYAWAQFCASHDKLAVYPETRKALEKAIFKGDKPVLARFYLGRVERMVGHDREAMNHFIEVLLDEPNNREAKTELRVLEQRIANAPKKR